MESYEIFTDLARGPATGVHMRLARVRHRGDRQLHRPRRRRDARHRDLPAARRARQGDQRRHAREVTAKVADAVGALRMAA